MTVSRSYDDPCGIARALDRIGERWALLIVRELLLGPRRFTDLRTGLPEASPNVLSHRLAELEHAGVVTRRTLPPPGAATVYELTTWGHELEPVILALARWGSRALPVPKGDLSPSALAFALRTTFVAERATGLCARVDLVIDDERFRADVAHRELAIARVTGDPRLERAPAPDSAPRLERAPAPDGAPRDRREPAAGRRDLDEPIGASRRHGRAIIGASRRDRREPTGASRREPTGASRREPTGASRREPARRDGPTTTDAFHLDRSETGPFHPRTVDGPDAVIWASARTLRAAVFALEDVRALCRDGALRMAGDVALATTFLGLFQRPTPAASPASA